MRFASPQTDNNGTPSLDSLDLIADNEEDYERWTAYLRNIIRKSQSILQYMMKGATMTKCRPKMQYDRKFFLTEEHDLRWEPCKDPTAKLKLSDVKFVKVGQLTPAFRRAKNVAQYESLSFSLVYGDDFDTLDLIAHNAQDFEIWVTGLSSLVSGAYDRLVCMYACVCVCV